MSQVVNELGSSFCSQSLALSLSEKGKSRSLIASAGCPIDLDGVAFRKELAKMRVGVLLRLVSTELLSLHKRDECGVELEVVSLNCGANNRRRDP